MCLCLFNRISVRINSLINSSADNSTVPDVVNKVEASAVAERVSVKSVSNIDSLLSAPLKSGRAADANSNNAGMHKTNDQRGVSGKRKGNVDTSHLDKALGSSRLNSGQNQSQNQNQNSKRASIRETSGGFVTNKKSRVGASDVNLNQSRPRPPSGGGGTGNNGSQADGFAQQSGFASAEEMIVFQQQQLMAMLQQQQQQQTAQHGYGYGSFPTHNQ